MCNYPFQSQPTIHNTVLTYASHLAKQFTLVYSPLGRHLSSHLHSIHTPYGVVV